MLKLAYNSGLSIFAIPGTSVLSPFSGKQKEQKAFMDKCTGKLNSPQERKFTVL